MDEINYIYRAAFAGLALGILFGFFSLRRDFCLRSLIVTKLAGERAKQIRQWMAAVLVSMIGIQYLIHQASLDLSETLYRMGELNPIMLLVGGLIFGIGMVLARGCPARHLALSATANLRSWVVLLIAAVAAYATISGIFAYIRVWLMNLWVIEIETDLSLFTFAFILGLMIFAILSVKGKLLKEGEILKDFINGVVIGLIVIAGFYLTAFYSFDEFDPTPPETLRIIQPLGESLIYVLTFTGASINFATALIGGIIIGSIIASLVYKRVEWRSFENPKSTLRYMLGGLLMGFGGVLSLGCTIGQGIVGLSTLSISAPLAVIGIFAGARLTLFWVDSA